MNMFIKANAKINLQLFLLNKDNDSKYRNLISTIIPISLYDHIFIKRSTENKIISNFKQIENNNLIQYLYSECNEKYFIYISKRIPLNSGMGGGTSDAIHIYKHLNLDNNNLLYRVGMDSFFFKNNKPSIVFGYGNYILPLNLNINKFHFLLITIKSNYKTTYIFELFNTLFKDKERWDGYRKTSQLIDTLKDNNIPSIGKLMINDFNHILKDLYKEEISLIDRILDSIEGVYGRTFTGTGSTYIVLIKDYNTYLRISSKLKRYYMKNIKIRYGHSL